MNKKRILALAMVVALVSGLVVTGCPAPAAPEAPEAPVAPVVPEKPVPKPEVVYLKWGSTSVRSGLYAGTVSEAKTVNEAYPGEIIITVVETGGYLENLIRLQKDLIHLGISCAGATYNSYTGTLDFEVANPDLRGFGPMYITPLNFLASKASGITRVEDFEGRPLASLPGGTSDRHVRLLFDANNIKPDYQWMGMGASIEAMKAGVVDGYLKAGYRDSAILDIAAAIDITIVSPTPELVEKLREKYPGHGLITGDIPAGLYPGQDEPVFSLWYSPMNTVDKDVPADVVYKITKALYENREAIAEPLAYLVAGDYVNFWELTKQYATVPLHPGAVKFFKEQGFEIPARLIPPEM